MNPFVSVIMPCLNEEKTVAFCVKKAREAFGKLRMKGEVIVADNGSTDASVREAQKSGARVVSVVQKGYGSALIAGIKAAKGDWLIMGDSDGTYDFREIGKLMMPLESGYDLVIGSRFKGKIKARAMPYLNRYLGTPALNLFLRFFYNLKLTDSQSGLRAFTKKSFGKLRLKTLGMEFASEMLVRAAQLKLRVAEVPIAYSKRLTPTKLSRFRDAWRHIRFLLLFAPTYLFLIPGLVLLAIGFGGMVILARGPAVIFGRQSDYHALIFASMLTLLGYQVVMLGVYAKAFSWTQGFDKKSLVIAGTLRYFRLEKGIILGALFSLSGLLIGLVTFINWAKAGFGALWEIRSAILSMTFFILGIQIIFSAFFLSILGIERQS